MRLLILLLIFCYYNVSAQNDSLSIKYTFLIHVAMDRSEGKLLLPDRKDVRNVSTLSSRGFKNIYFYAFHFDKVPEIGNTEIDKSNKTMFQCYYIIAYNENQNKIYHLKGFKNNDFKEFYTYEISNFFKKGSKSSRKLIKNISLKEEYYIEDLDIECLYKSIICDKGNKLGCDFSCEDRDKYGMISK